MFRLYLVGNRRQGDGSPPATGSLQGRAGLEPVAQQTQTARNTQRECPVQTAYWVRKSDYGVFREIDAKGRIVMYCMKLEDGPVRYSLREVVGPAEDYQLEPINVGQREELAKELEKAGVLWNGFYKRIEPVNYLAPAGKGYYYLDEFWEVCRTIEQGKTKGAKYFNNGNYSRYRNGWRKLRRYLLNELGVGPVSRSEESVYYYLKEFWKVCRTTDKGRRRDIKRARSGNYSTDEASIRELALQLQEKREGTTVPLSVKGIN